MKVSEVKKVIDKIIKDLESEKNGSNNNITKVLNYQHTMGKYHGLLDLFYPLNEDNSDDFIKIATYKKPELDTICEFFNSNLIEDLYKNNRTLKDIILKKDEIITEMRLKINALEGAMQSELPF